MPSSTPNAVTAGAFTLTDRAKKILWWSLGFMFIARLICSALVPLTDTSEARYGEIARKMLETGNWVTPLHDYNVDRAACEPTFCVVLGNQSYGVPFWAKPPLSTWLSAFSMKLFGVNTFAARLPSLLLGMGMLLLVWQWCAQRRGRDFALMVCATLSGMSLFFMASGAVMTDSSLAFCTTLTMIAFWRALPTANTSDSSNRYWGYLFFVGLGLGLLAKGPLVGVLTFLPILPWVLFHKGESRHKNWLQVWRALPWIRGTVLMLIIGAPWYFIAEHQTPGFLSYFIVGEHFGRFLNAHWHGDKYGNAHAEPLGTIWMYWLLAALPWSLVALARLKPLVRASRLWHAENDGLFVYLSLWAFLPMVFFTFAHNIIWTYPLPSLPALAILIVELLARDRTAKSPLPPRLSALHFVTAAVLLVYAMLYHFERYDIAKASQRDATQWYLHARPSVDSKLFTYRKRYYSAEFYSAGKAKMIESKTLSELFENTTTDFLIIQSDDLQRITPSLHGRLRSLKTFGEFELLEEIPPARAEP